MFPLLSPTTFFLLVINIVYAFFDTFAIVDAATQGGPGKDTAILVYKVYYDGFKALDLGGSAAQSVVLMVDRRRAHRGAVPLRREEGALLMQPDGRTPPHRSTVHRPRSCWCSAWWSSPSRST